MSTTQLIEDLHNHHVGQESKLKEVIDKVNEEWTLTIKVVALCAQGPHLIGGLFTSGSDKCVPHCPTCLAKRYLSNSLTEEDLKLLGVSK